MDPGLLLPQPVGSHAANLPAGPSVQSCSENTLKFTCEFQPEPGPPQAPGDEYYSMDMDYESVSVVLPAQCSVYQLRLRICMQVVKTVVKSVLLRYCLNVWFEPLEVVWCNSWKFLYLNAVTAGPSVINTFTRAFFLWILWWRYFHNCFGSGARLLLLTKTAIKTNI